jgi:hypothetical protein
VLTVEFVVSLELILAFQEMLVLKQVQQLVDVMDKQVGQDLVLVWACIWLL